MILFKTVRESASAEQIIEKSRFITHVIPAETREEAEAFFAEIKKKYKDATHNVPAMVLGDKFQIQWGSDDGEPQGTSGAPIVQMLVSEGITNVALVVTRYFGGIKLGTGGLVRAYTGSARLGIDAAGVCSVREAVSFKCRMDYSLLGKIQNMESKSDYTIGEIAYTDKVTAELICEPECLDGVRELVTNLSGGTAEIFDEKEELVKD